MESLQKEGLQPKTTSSYFLTVKKLCSFLSLYGEIARSIGISETDLSDTLRSVDDLAAVVRKATAKRESDRKSQVSGMYSE